MASGLFVQHSHDKTKNSTVKKPPVSGGLPSQRAVYAKIVSMSSQHDGCLFGQTHWTGPLSEILSEKSPDAQSLQWLDAFTVSLPSPRAVKRDCQ